MEENSQDDVSKIDQIKKDIDAAYEAYSSTYERCAEDLIFANGTDSSQFGADDASVRGEGRAQFQFPVLDKFIERTVGGYNAAPFGIVFTPLNPDKAVQARMLSGVAKGIETRSGAKAVYRNALRSAVTTGYGWIHLTTEYDNSEDLSMDVSIKIEAIYDYSAVLIDPLSREIDARDARYMVHIDYMHPREAKEMYGEDVMLHQYEGGLFESKIQKGDPDDSIPVVTFYEKVTKKETISILDGAEVEEGTPGARTKEKSVTSVNCTKTVGNKIIYDEDMGIKQIPIVPVYGLPITEDGVPRAVGIIHRAKDAQRILNYSASLSAERLALSNKANYLISDRAISGYEELWKNSSRSNVPALIFRDWDPQTNQPIAPPMKQDVAVNINDVMQSQANMMSLISSITGLPENGFGEAAGRMETAEAALLKARSAETILSTVYENLAASIEQCGRVMLDMVSVFYDTDRTVPMEIDGKPSRREVPFTQMDIIPNEYEVASQAGPLLATQRKENLRSLLAVAQMMGPSAMAIMPEIIENIDLDDVNGTIKQKVEGIAQMAMQAGGDPAAQQQQMADLEQQMELLKQTNMQLNQQLIQEKVNMTESEMKIRADLTKTQMNNDNKLDVERMKIQGNITEQDLKADQDVNKMILENRMELEQDMREEADEVQDFLNSLIPPSIL